MTITQVVEALIKEKQEELPSRFPCRAIMVKNVEQYCELLSELQKIPDISKVPAEDLFPSSDVMPHYVKLKEAQYSDKWLILTGVSEYLRLFNKSEASSQRFAKLWGYQASASSKGRIIIPLWGCEAQWHDHALHLCEDTRQDDYYVDCSDLNADEQQMSLLVLSGAFEQYTSQMTSQNGQLCIGLQEWYEYWANPISEKNKQILLTTRYASIQPTTGNISIRVIRDMFSFVRENLRDGECLTKENCPEIVQELLFDKAIAGEKLDDAILNKLNVAQFVSADIMGKWSALKEGQRQLIVLWMKLHPDESYLCHCIEASTSCDDLMNHIVHDIFALRRTHPAWVEESQQLIAAMKLPKDALFFRELDKIPAYEERLQYLSGKEKEERIYLLHMVGKWMREDYVQVLQCQTLATVYPELFAYLDGKQYDEDLRRYFSLYKSYKLANTLPSDEELYFSGIRADAYEYRYSVLSNDIIDHCIILWIDALGAEWLPLLSWSLMNIPDSAVKTIAIAQAVLPTETCFNEQWYQMDAPHEKLDKLDKLAHKGVIDNQDYYACVEEQLSFVHSIAKEVAKLLENYQRVIITGDHGTSRLAARFFHNREGMLPPSGAIVCSHGRYCKLMSPATVHSYQVAAKDQEENQYVVFSNYDHYKQSGFAAGSDDENAIYGEVHGGATPEEMLVPVIVIDTTKELPLTADWQKSTVKIMMKKVKNALTFNRPVQTLQVMIGANKGICMPLSDKEHWTVQFQGIAPGTYTASIVADGSLVHVDAFTIQSALGGGDGDLP